MSDPNIEDFYGRVARIERDHAKGVAFVAEGTLGRTPARTARRRGATVVRSVLFVLAVIFLFKAVLIDQIGEAAYRDKVAALEAGSLIDRFSAAVIAPDALSLRLAGLIGRLG